MLELDLMVGGWAKNFVNKLTFEQCIAFENQVLSQETPNLYFQLLGTDRSEKEILPEYIQKIRTQFNCEMNF